jgi:hypothetical protein
MASAKPLPRVSPSAEPASFSATSRRVRRATGLVILTLQIAYLPTLYAAFNRRETQVVLLSERPGAVVGPRTAGAHPLRAGNRGVDPGYDARSVRAVGSWADDVAEPCYAGVHAG